MLSAMVQIDKLTFVFKRNSPMKKSMVSLLAALAIAATVQAPARADGDALMQVAKVPIAVTAFTFGTVFGTPIAVSRKSFQNTVDTTNQVFGDDANPVVKGGGGLLLGLPVGLFTGTLEGMYLGVKNAAMGASGDAPFGSETFSLGDLD